MRVIMFVATTAAFAVASPVSADQNSDHRSTHDRCAQQHLKRAYAINYRRVASRFDRRAPGRNILRQGLRNGRRASCHDLGRSVRTFKRWLAPPRGTSYPADRAPTSWRTAPHTTGGRYAIPDYIVSRESGGSYTAVNASTGAYGAYQIMPFHWGPGGECAGLGKDPAGQDACASILWNGGAGSHHWAATR